MEKALGTHVLLEFFGCDPQPLASREVVEKTFLEAARQAKVKIVDVFFHQFQPYGVSGVVVIEESHFTIHTWPEHGYAAIDLFYCSPDVDAEAAIRVMTEVFKPSNVSMIEMKRGLRITVEKPLTSVTQTE